MTIFFGFAHGNARSMFLHDLGVVSDPFLMFIFHRMTYILLQKIAILHIYK